jgi:hypothetical protein
MERDPISTTIYLSSAAEGTMKIQEVILRAIKGWLKWYQKGEIPGISDPQGRRWKQCQEERG